jgi:hypothetical protein
MIFNLNLLVSMIFQEKQLYFNTDCSINHKKLLRSRLCMEELTKSILDWVGMKMIKN